MKRRNLFRKSLSVLLGAVLVIAVLSTGTIDSVQAEETTSGFCGEKVTWSLDDDTLTISGTGAMTNYSYTYAPWYSNRSSIRSVVIGAGVTTIGNLAFYQCDRLESITIPGRVETIGASAFGGCESLTSITISERVTTIGVNAFWGCNMLTSITIPESVETIGYSAFNNCSSLESITILGSVTTIGGSAFFGCVNLTSITIPESVTTIGDFAFASCSSLETIYLPSGATIGNSAIPGTAWQIKYEVDEENQTIRITEIKGGSNTSGKITIPETIGGYPVASVENGQGYVGEHTHYGGANPCTEGYTCAICGEYVAPLGHAYGAPEFEWSEDCNVATASFTCIRGDDTQTVDCSVEITDKIDATCTGDGETVYTATVKYGNENYSDTRTVTEQPLGHAYGAPEFEWADDYSSCTAVFTCEHDSSHVEREACVITSETTKKATTAAEGELTYTATVEFEKASYTDKKTKAIAKLPSGGGSAPVSSTTPGQTNTAPEPDSSTVVTVNEDGTTTETTAETVTNEAGNEVEVTTVVYKDADGNITGCEVVSVIPEADRNTSATITVTRDAQEYVTDASAEVTTLRTGKTGGVNATLTGNVVSQIAEAAGVEPVEITVNVTGVKGKTKYTVTVDSADLKAGNELRAVAVDPETGEYLLVNARTYTVTQEGGIEVSLHSGRAYELVTAEKAVAIEAAVLKTIKVEKASATLKPGKTTYIRLDSALDMANVKKITYSSNKKKVATVDKNGKITAKKAGTATISAKVTLKSGASKTVKMKIKVKK